MSEALQPDSIRARDPIKHVFIWLVAGPC
jgi:hypothetical protein